MHHRTVREIYHQCAMQTRTCTPQAGRPVLQRSTHLIAAQPIAFAPLPKAGVRSRQLVVKTHATATLDGKPRLDVDEDKEARLEQFRVVRDCNTRLRL